MSHRFLLLLITIWTCWLSLPEHAQASLHARHGAGRVQSQLLLAQADPNATSGSEEDTGSSLLDDPAIDDEAENDSGSSLLDGAEEAETPRAMMQAGSEGPGVEAIQRKLSELGYFTGTVDGVYGATTETAVQQFQEAEGLEATGQIDLKTWERIQTSNQALVSDTSESEESGNEETASATSPNSANSATNANPPATENAAQANAAQSSWTVQRILLVSGVAIFGLVAIAGMSLSVWRWLTRSSTQPDDVLTDTDNIGAADLPNPAHPHAINTTATPIESISADAGATNTTVTHNGTYATAPITNPELASPPPETRVQETRPDPFATPSVDRGTAPVAPHSKPPSAAQIGSTGAGGDGQANGSAPLQPAHVSPTTRLSKANLIESLIQDLNSIDSTVRRKAIWQLGQQGTTQAIQPLVDLMMDSDSQQRSLILAALSEIGERTLNPMHRALAMSLQDENAEVRKNAIRDLTRIYDQVAQLAPLLRHAMEDDDPSVRDTATWALNQLNRQAKQASFQPNSSPAQLNQSSSAEDIWHNSQE